MKTGEVAEVESKVEAGKVEKPSLFRNPKFRKAMRVAAKVAVVVVTAGTGIAVGYALGRNSGKGSEQLVVNPEDLNVADATDVNIA